MDRNSLTVLRYRFFNMTTRRQFIKLVAPTLFIPKCLNGQAYFLSDQSLLGNSSPGSSTPIYDPNATNFDGTNDYLTRGAGLTGAADNKVGTISFWAKFGDDTEAVRTLFVGNYPTGGASQIGLHVYRDGQYRIYIDAYNSAGTRILARQTLDGTDAFTVANGWRHLMASWNLATLTVHLYVNGSDSNSGTGEVTTNDTIDWTQTDWAIGAYIDGTTKCNACLADVYINTAEYIDLSNSTNRQKFYNSGPVNLGADGSTPTGTAPTIYLPNAFGTFQNNVGTGGNFSVTGSLTACSDTP